MKDITGRKSKRRIIRLLIRCCVFAAAVCLALSIFLPPQFSLVLPSLSPHVAICSAIATRTVTLATLIALPVLLLITVFPRFFCRYACPLGLLTEHTSLLSKKGTALISAKKKKGSGLFFAGCPSGCPSERAEKSVMSPFSGRSMAGRLPPVGRWLLLCTLGGALLGYPWFLWLDPLAVFNGIFTLRHDPASPAGLASAVVLGIILTISFLLPGAWCMRLCPLGATQDLLALPRSLSRRRKPSSAPAPNGRQPLLSRRSALSAALGTVFIGLGAGSASAMSRLLLRESSNVLRPPGSLDPPSFAGLCIRCGNCIRACPTGIIQPAPVSDGVAGFLTPKLSFENGYCREDCHLCTQICPSGAIARLSLEAKNRAPIGLAKFDPSICILMEDRECDICKRACPYEAIEMVWCEEEYVPLPTVDPEKCPGCGACQVICPGTNDWEREHSEDPIPPRKAIQVY